MSLSNEDNAFVGLLERSNCIVDEGLLHARLAERKYNDVGLRCADSIDTAAALERSRGLDTKGSNAKALLFHCSAQQQKAVYRFPGTCFGDLARKAICDTTDLFREVTCILHDNDYRRCVHECAKCEDHFPGYLIEVDHVEINFHTILVAFLDSHVKDWCILPDHDTVDNRRGKIQSYSQRIKYANREKESDFWQRVKNVSEARWVAEELGKKFVAFHNSVAKLQTLCLTCHDRKINGPFIAENVLVPLVAPPIFVEELGKSKKRKRDEELMRRQPPLSQPAVYS